jgi:hypothetical protein
VILPADPGYALLIERLSVDRTMDRVYADPNFEVYRMMTAPQTGVQATPETGQRAASSG